MATTEAAECPMFRFRSNAWCSWIDGRSVEEPVSSSSSGKTSGSTTTPLCRSAGSVEGS